MPGNKELGAVLRELRKSRGLTLGAVARHAGCAESLVSYVESGNRQLHPWLASRLDEVYRTGGAVAALLHSTSQATSGATPLSSDTVIVEQPADGVSMPLSRRELLIALGVGITGGLLRDQFEQALDAIPLTDDTLRRCEDSYSGFQTAARTLPPGHLIDGMIGNVAVLDGLRHRAGARERPRYSRMQARYAETLSWLSEEAGDPVNAMYWIDRASQWGQAADWHGMSAYGFVRRSMMAVSFSSDGSRAIDNAMTVMSLTDVSPRIRGLAAKQMAFGYALTGAASASDRSLDDAMRLLSEPLREDDAVLGQRSVVDDDLFAIFRATCDIYLGRGERVVPVLAPRVASLSASSARTATITRAKLARAYANAGQPEEAAHWSLAALDDIGRVGSLSARSELKRALPVLNNWHGREDVQMVMRRIKSRD
ncbi:helix-turn-helix domain-containing protein [Actinokineospora iranica]|uniref:Helix-turn-helix domain-containing protein n=1 Tax=Actinokineospora iranica TaxID=1271860 RepID=A0A1G6U782_9PSEU|nr:helix-turn-helix transcriptional regulator [Actinokineospora iranica]SDD37151.1 Helix-turn-helix domain-containing protein [Actinokineospora iranica]